MRRGTRGGQAARRRSCLQRKKKRQTWSVLQTQISMRVPILFAEIPGVQEPYYPNKAARRINRFTPSICVEHQLLQWLGRTAKDGHLASRRSPAACPSAYISMISRARVALGTRLRGYNLLGARERAKHPRTTCLCASTSSWPRSGRARAQTIERRLGVPKDQHFVSTCRRVRHPRGREPAPK